jgi:hypothetical protein
MSGERPSEEREAMPEEDVRRLAAKLAAGEGQLWGRVPTWWTSGAFVYGARTSAALIEALALLDSARARLAEAESLGRDREREQDARIQALEAERDHWREVNVALRAERDEESAASEAHLARLRETQMRDIAALRAENERLRAEVERLSTWSASVYRKERAALDASARAAAIEEMHVGIVCEIDAQRTTVWHEYGGQADDVERGLDEALLAVARARTSLLAQPAPAQAEQASEVPHGRCECGKPKEHGGTDRGTSMLSCHACCFEAGGAGACFCGLTRSAWVARAAKEST